MKRRVFVYGWFIFLSTITLIASFIVPEKYLWLVSAGSLVLVCHTDEIFDYFGIS